MQDFKLKIIYFSQLSHLVLKRMAFLFVNKLSTVHTYRRFIFFYMSKYAFVFMGVDTFKNICYTGNINLTIYFICH